jgi:hypothetical protein
VDLLEADAGAGPVGTRCAGRFYRESDSRPFRDIRPLVGVGDRAMIGAQLKNRRAGFL